MKYCVLCILLIVVMCMSVSSQDISFGYNMLEAQSEYFNQTVYYQYEGETLKKILIDISSRDQKNIIGNGYLLYSLDSTRVKVDYAIYNPIVIYSMPINIYNIKKDDLGRIVEYTMYNGAAESVKYNIVYSKNRLNKVTHSTDESKEPGNISNNIVLGDNSMTINYNNMIETYTKLSKSEIDTKIKYALIENFIYILQNRDKYYNLDPQYYHDIPETVINTLSKDELKLFRNTIFACYGYHFNNATLFDLFNYTSWYNDLGKSNDVVINELSDYHRFLLNLIIQSEK